ncbi:MAG TPA: hypothetical protein PKC30_00500 [Saprospiraceae bacterium]|nr:hypothetical protein [Saprospiraceae bacterium]
MIIFIIGLATINGCQSPNGENKPLQIIPNRYESHIDFSHHIKDLTFILLSVEKNLPLNSIQKFQFDKDYFFVRSFGSRSIHMFDKKGTRLKVIDGTDEDVNPEGFSYDFVDFTVDRANQIL